jgi:hypothetical protein
MDYHYHIHHRRQHSRQRSNLFYNNHDDCTPSLPTDCIPVEELAASPSILAFRGLRICRQSRPTPTHPASFFEYLLSLSSWDRRLLQHVEILDCDALADYFSTDGALFIVSDGGAANERGSYGAVRFGTNFRDHRRRSPGFCTGSFRVESYGCLAILQFVYHFRLHHRLDPILCRNDFYCDNQGLITRLNFAAGPLFPFPWHFLRSDVDIEMQILDTIRLRNIKMGYHHVKGHQDTATSGMDKTKQPLSRQAQFNVECDHLATAHCELLAPPPPSLSSRPAK